MSTLPFLPGYTFNDPNKKTHSRPQQFNFRNGVAVQDGPAKPATVYKVPLPDGVGPAWKTASGEAPPTWLAFEKKALKFEAFFEETVPHSKDPKRVRNVNIYYYLEDGTVMIEEPKVQNSGIPQGVLVRRHRAQKSDGSVFQWDDFNVGVDVMLFGVSYHITNADQYTQDFYAQAGSPLNESQFAPTDSHTEYRAKMLAAMRPVRQGKTGPDPLRRFLDNDGKVLRFYCLWEDRTSARGELRNFVLLYFLADDTLQVNEALPANSGRDPFPVFAKRQTPPKDFVGLESLVIGNTVTIFNRRLTIYTVDVYTQEFYREHFGINDFTPLQVQQEEKASFTREIPKYNGFGTEEDSLVSCLSLVPKPPKKDFQKLIENDKKVLQFSARIESKKPEDQTREFVVTYFLADDTVSIFEPQQRNTGVTGGKFLERRKLKKPSSAPLPFAAYSRTVTQARMASPSNNTYNGGYTTGSRPSSSGSQTPLSPVRTRTATGPGSPNRTAAYGRSSPSPPTSPGSLPGIDGEYYSAPDMYIGAVIEANKHKFVLQDASKFAFEYMEANPHQFPYSSVDRALPKLMAAVANDPSLVGDLFAEADPEGKGVVSMEGFKNVMRQVVSSDISDHEIVLVGRQYDKKEDKNVAYAEFFKDSVN